MGYSRRILNSVEGIILFDLTHITSKIDLVAIGVETPRIDNNYDRSCSN